MEQARYWMWSKPKNSFYGDSWEEQAFAVDVDGSLGGCVWPPRSYSCSFCRREFRSAQALGGHMNVHRRDRARLKQSQNSLDHDLCHQNQHLNHSAPLDLENPSQMSNKMVSNPNTNFDSSRYRVLEKPTTLPFFSSSIVEWPQITSSIFQLPSRSKLGAQSNLIHIFDINNEEKITKSVRSGNIDEKVDLVETDLSISSNILHRKRSTSCEGGEEENINHKRQRIVSLSSSSFSEENSGDKNDFQSEVLELSSISIGGLDLELKLGDGPKLK